MAYFANGEQGSIYEDRYCARCAHRRDPNEGECCPVLLLHLLWNYEQSSDTTKATALSTLIPRQGTGNLQCELFSEDTEPREWETPQVAPACIPVGPPVGVEYLDETY